MTESNVLIVKRGVRVGFSWEPLVNSARGHSVPVGVRWVQWIGWLRDWALYAAYVRLESRLSRSRFFYSASGYDWLPASFDGFSQRTKWVKEDD